MKRVFLILAFIAMFGSDVFAQSKPSEQVSSDVVQSLLEQNEAKSKQLETLDSLYNRISAEVLIMDGLINALLEPANNRFGGATADCANGQSVSCSGTTCTSEDNVGCACYSSNGEGGTTIDSAFCSDEAIIAAP